MSLGEERERATEAKTRRDCRGKEVNNKTSKYRMGKEMPSDENFTKTDRAESR